MNGTRLDAHIQWYRWSSLASGPKKAHTHPVIQAPSLTNDRNTDSVFNCHQGVAHWRRKRCEKPVIYWLVMPDWKRGVFLTWVTHIQTVIHIVTQVWTDHTYIHVHRQIHSLMGYYLCKKYISWDIYQRVIGTFHSIL